MRYSFPNIPFHVHTLHEFLHPYHKCIRTSSPPPSSSAPFFPLPLQLTLPALNSPLLKILPYHPSRHLHHRLILHCRRHINLLLILPPRRILHQLPQHPPQRLPAAGLRNHPPPLNHSAQRRDRADLLADVAVDLFEKLIGRTSRKVSRRVGGGDEREGEVAFHRVWDSHNAGFGDGGGGQDRLFDGACVVLAKSMPSKPETG
jgi:hypothetical protein